MPRKRRQKSRVVLAPEPTVPSACLPNRVVSVVLRPGEQVRWTWTSGPQGQYVSGYTIIKRRRSLASLDDADSAVDRLWAKEAEERLAAYPLYEVM
jgi:hypothetical protein